MHCVSLTITGDEASQCNATSRGYQIPDPLRSRFQSHCMFFLAILRSVNNNMQLVMSSCLLHGLC